MSKPELDDQELKRVLGGMSEAELKQLIETSNGLASIGSLKGVNSFIPNEDQIPIANSHKKNVVVFGGNRSGKSHIAAFIVSCHATGIYPSWWQGIRFSDPPSIGVVSITAEQLRKSSQKKLMGEFYNIGTGFIPKDKIIRTTPRQGVVGALDTALIRHVSGGITKIEFMLNEQGQEKFMGFEWNFCIAEGEQVHMADGSMKAIEEIEPGEFVLGMDNEGVLGPREVKAVHDRGVRSTIDIWAKRGPSLRLTPDHEVFTSLTKKAEAQTASKTVQFPMGWEPPSPENRDDAWYAWTALICAEGCYSQKKVTMGECPAMESALALLPNQGMVRKFDFKAHGHNHVPDWFLNWDAIWDEFKANKSDTIEIPEWVFKSSNDKIALFLGYLYAGDGWLSGETIGYASTSRKLANQISMLLWRLGVQSVVRTRVSTTENWKDQFWVVVKSSSNVLRFLDQVNVLGKEKAADVVRKEATRRATSRESQNEIIRAAIKERWAKNPRKGRIRTKRPSLDFEVGIKKQTNAVETKVYDLSVEGEHRFFVNNHLVSNCWGDEELDKEVFDEIKMRLLDLGGHMLLSFAPLKGQTDLIQHIDTIPEEYIDIFRLDWYSNPHLPKDAVAEMEATMSDSDKESRKLGRANYGEGRVFTFPPEKYTCDPFEVEPWWPVLGAIDPGYGHATGAVKGYEDPESGVIYITAEYWSKENTPIIHAPVFKSWGNMEFKLDRKSKTRDQTSGMSVMDMYLDLGLNVTEAETNAGSVEASIAMINTLIMQGKLQIFKTCRKLLDQMAMYRRAKNKSTGKVSIVMKDNDLIDPLRYRILHSEDARPMGVPKKMEYASPKIVDFQPMDSRIGY